MQDKDLAGKRIVITRAREQASVLRDALEACGAEVIEVPTIEIRDPASWEPLDAAVRRLNEFHFLLLTSVNGVRNFLGRLRAGGRDVKDLRHLEVGAIGPSTAAALVESGIKVDFVPREYRAEGLVESLAGRDLRGKAFLIPRAKVARDLVPRVLQERGARVEVVEAYETVRPRLAPGELESLLTPRPDVITFTSSSTVSNFGKLLDDAKLRDCTRGAAVASIGPITSATARESGFEVSVEATAFTIPGLVAAIVKFFAGGRV
jgi:uroporphyrinogen III methyltransferase / synthase